MRYLKIGVFVFLLIFLIIYEFGGRQYLAMRNAIEKRTESEQKQLQEMVFGNKIEKTSGGIIIALRKNWLLVWEQVWPKLYRIDNKKTKFYFREMCSPEILKRADNLETITINSELLTIEKWKERMPKYGIVWLKYDIIDNKTMVEEIDGYEAFFVKKGSLKQQCERF